MGLSLLFQGAATAASVGMGCGTCCGSGISVFLSGYLMTHAKNFGESLRAFVSFYLGKIMAVMAVCFAASVIGSRIMDESGRIGIVPVHVLVDAGMIVMGLWLLVRWFRDRRGRAPCGGRCAARSERKYEGGSVSLPALWGMGVGYGISPCAPLLVMAGYSATLPPAAALAVGGVFAVCSALSPTLLLLLLSGVLAGKMYREIPRCLTWFRLGCYFLLMAFFSADLIKTLL